MMLRCQQKPMKVKFDKYESLSTPYFPEKGMFGRPKSVTNGWYRVEHWTRCREIFHNILFNTRLFFYSHHRGKSIATFLAIVEERLNVIPRSQIGPTQRKGLIWIRPSRWWTFLGMRRSLFTILLRAGAHYTHTKPNFDEAVQKEKYLKTTLYAFNRFMEGHTKYVGRKRGWYKQFCELNPSEAEVDKLLVKPENKTKRDI